MVLSHVLSRNCHRPDAELDGLWIVGSPVPPVSHIITSHALATWSAGKCAAIVPSHPAHEPVAGGGGGGAGAGAAVVDVVGGGGGASVVVVVAGATVVDVVGGWK